MKRAECQVHTPAFVLEGAVDNLKCMHMYKQCYVGRLSDFSSTLIGDFLITSRIGKSEVVATPSVGNE